MRRTKKTAADTLPGITDRRIAALVTLLAENATVVVSGARVARQIGVSRSTVWKWVERLRELGVRVKGHPRTGYFLERVPDILTADMLRQRLKGSLFGKHIYHFFKVDSTNRVALELGHAGEPEGAIILGEEQTAGRGRAGRGWHSERAAGIYVTLLLRPKLAPVQAPLLTMMAGLSAHTAIQAQTGLAVDLKWPNDLLIGGKKAGGILTEMHAEPDRVHFVIVGIGIDVNHTAMPAELAGDLQDHELAGPRREPAIPAELGEFGRDTEEGIVGRLVGQIVQFRTGDRVPSGAAAQLSAPRRRRAARRSQRR